MAELINRLRELRVGQELARAALCTDYNKGFEMALESNSEMADRLTRRRARMLPVLAVAFIAQQTTFFSRSDQVLRPVHLIQDGAWLILSVVLLLALTTGGFWFKPARVRALMDDELTRAHRADSFRTGFLAMMAGAIALYILSLFEPLTAREAIHLLMTIGIAAALLRFGKLERRALKG